MFTSKIIPIGLLLIGAPLCATTLINDTFDLGASPSVGNDLDDADDTTWTVISGHSGIAINSSNVLGSGNVLAGTVGNNSVNLLGTTFASQTLTSINDSISLSFDYRWVNSTAGNTARVPVFGLYNSMATVSDYTNDVGYNAQTVTTGTSNLRIAREVNVSDNPLTGVETSLSIIGSNTYAITSAIQHYSLTLTRIADTNSDTNDDLLVTVSATDGTTTVSITAIDTAAYNTGTFTFDEVFIRSASTNYYLDNVNVEFTASSIPEPGSYALLAGAATMALVTLRRRRRNTS